LAAGGVAAILLLEILLNLYNPLQVRIKGNHIVLLANKTYHLKNDSIPSLDPVVTVTRNSLGFRGPNPPKDFGDHLTIISVGGSTTQCFLLSDDETWTARLATHLKQSFSNIWVNNAGLDGHSTHGHIVLLEDYICKLHPKVVLFLIGANDIDRSSNEEFDAENVKGHILFNSPKAFVKSLSAYSEVASLLGGLYRSVNAYKLGLMHQFIELRRVPYRDPSKDTADRYIASHTQDSALRAFQDRVNRLIAICHANGIEPVLITQPILVGFGVDDLTKVDLARISIDPGLNGNTQWRILEAFNDVTRRVGREQNVIVVDLAHRLPKSSRYYYDFIHYTNAGAQAIADILYQDLCPALGKQFPGYFSGSCPLCSKR